MDYGQYGMGKGGSYDEQDKGGDRQRQFYDGDQGKGRGEGQGYGNRGTHRGTVDYSGRDGRGYGILDGKGQQEGYRQDRMQQQQLDDDEEQGRFSQGYQGKAEGGSGRKARPELGRDRSERGTNRSPERADRKPGERDGARQGSYGGERTQHWDSRDARARGDHSRREQDESQDAYLSPEYNDINDAHKSHREFSRSASGRSASFQEEEDEECAFAPGSPTGRQGTDLMARKAAMRKSGGAI